MPQSMQVSASIQKKERPRWLAPWPGWMHATGQASTQSATPSQISVTIVWAIGGVVRWGGS
jgi:hypothetical protein